MPIIKSGMTIKETEEVARARFCEYLPLPAVVREKRKRNRHRGADPSIGHKKRRVGSADLQVLQVIVAGLDAGEWVFGVVVLHDVMLQPGLLRGGEDGGEVDLARTDRYHIFLAADVGYVFDVAQVEAARVAGEVVERVFARLHDPEEVEFNRHEVRVGVFEQRVEGDGTVYFLELEVVVVIAEPDTALFAGSAVAV